MKNISWIAGVALLALVTMTGCGDDTPAGTTSESVQSAEDNAVAENEFASVFEIVDDDATENSTFGKVSTTSDLMPSCATRTVDSIARTITIDFGSTNCLCKDGIYRRGKIFAQFIGNYKEVGSTVIVSLVDYYANDNKVTGTKTIQRLAVGKFSVTVTDASITTPNGTITWASQRTVERIEGQGTRTPWDDLYQYTGSASGTNRQGKSYTVTIDQPLKKRIQLGCMRNFIAGKLTVTNSDDKVMTLDYDPIGGEPCDKVAQVTINGVTRTITLR